MPTNSYSALSPADFETLAADVLRVVPKEQHKMQALGTPPSRYFLVTACSLTPGNKDAILKAIQEKLAKLHSCLIVGDPGIGKSTTAGQVLLLKARQADGQLKLIFTTRQYILEQALNQFGDSHTAVTQLCQRAVHLQHNNAKLRAELVYQRVHAAGFTQAQRAVVVQQKLYWPLLDALIHSLEHFDWGLRNFKITQASRSPLALTANQREALFEKLLTLLSEPGSCLLESYKGGTMEWFNRPDTFGDKLTQLWQVVMGDDQQAFDLASKLKNRLPEAAGWPALYQQSGTAEFYRFNSDARKALKPKHKQLKRRILAACENEIDSINDPDLLNEVLGDVYRIEEALSLDLRPLIHEIYDKAFDNEEGVGHYDDLHTTYYQSPEVPDEQAEIERQLRGMVAEVDERFAALCG